MSKVAIKGADTGTATFTIEAPATNTNRTLTLPDAAGSVVLDSATQTLTNKTLGSGTVAGASLLTSDTAKTASGTVVDFTGIPSWARRVTVMFDGVSTNGTSGLLVQVGSGSVASTGYSSSSESGGSVLASASGFVVRAVLATDSCRGVVSLNLHTVSSNLWVSSHTIFRTNNLAAGAGSVTLSGPLDRIRITTVNGTDTFDAGTINIMWE